MLILLTIILGYTYSKYATSKEVTSSTATATWNFDGSISNTDSEVTKSISLGNTLKDGSYVTEKIAPGTSGSFRIIINARGSEVNIDYDVLLKEEENNKPKNLYFTCEDLVNAKDENNELIKYYSLSDMLKVDSQTNRSNLSGTITRENNLNAKVITVNWEWPYETITDNVIQDEQDTNDSGIQNYNFKLSIVGKQSE